MTYGVSHRGFMSGKLYRCECVTCGKDTPHRLGACVYCKTPTSIKTIEKRKREREITSEVGKKYGSGASFRRIHAALNYYDRNRILIQKARKKAFHEAAERSRQMFEGKGK